MNTWMEKCTQVCGVVMEQARKLSDQPRRRRGERRRLVVTQIHSTVINPARPEAAVHLFSHPQVCSMQCCLFIINFLGFFSVVFFPSSHFMFVTWRAFFDLFNFAGQSFGGLYKKAEYLLYIPLCDLVV